MGALRKSNTEPVIRIYAEAPAIEQADFLANEVITAIRYFIAGIKNNYHQ
jgi:phosphomannomutase